jgi:hypothetical protein
MNVSAYCDMTPESRNSLLLGNGGNGLVNIKRGIVGNGVFYSARAKWL